MISEVEKKDFYQALIHKDPCYEGIFYVGVRSTGIFCRPTCSARKPKVENCEFFKTAEEALLASYRPCLRCRPLSHPNLVSPLVQLLVNAVEKEPEKHWREADFDQLAVDASTARRHFKKRFGMTFVQYARARRMGLAFQKIRSGDLVINAQLDCGYESSSGFRDAFSKIMGAPPTKKNAQLTLVRAHWFDTKIGPMLAIGDEKAIHLLEFSGRRGLESEIKELRHKLHSAIVPGITEPIQLLAREIQLYFEGTLREFTTPLYMSGTPFQQEVWKGLQSIPYGETRSYKEQACSLQKPLAHRAVANANGRNKIAIIIPCHRVVRSNGDLGGYGGGINRKQWLIDHEKNNILEER